MSRSGYAPLAAARVATACVVTAVAVAACGGADPGTADESAPPAAGEVDVADMKFTPATITVAVGDTVTWHFDDGGVPHNVTGATDAESFIRSPILRESDYSITFDKPGTYHYTCTLHPQMTGTVVVQ